MSWCPQYPWQRVELTATQVKLTATFVVIFFLEGPPGFRGGVGLEGPIGHDVSEMLFDSKSTRHFENVSKSH